MGKRTPAVDVYIAEAPAYSRPILEKLRDSFHAGCPAIEERLKWGMPSFEYKGLLGGMAAFKKHVTFGFWKSKLMEEFTRNHPYEGQPRGGMMGAKVETTADLPPKKVLVSYVKEAKRLNDDGIKEPRAPRPKAPLRVVVPPDLKQALARNKKAQSTFDAFPPSCRREYVEWITEAKRAETRVKRLATTVEWLSQGKRRNWKYENC
jgi:uncharacterized protein YdeI (YjbR/CyaY-like superfamily)